LSGGCFVIPNPWDIGTACFLHHIGFRALATTSGGFQFSRGKADTVWGLSRDAALAHIADIAGVSDLPLNADFQSGYAHNPEHVAENAALCVETGVAGLSIEDGTGNPPTGRGRVRAATGEQWTTRLIFRCMLLQLPSLC
jgi:2-methylisocitrate lyase-like PEP mutase family enzyme